MIAFLKSLVVNEHNYIEMHFLTDCMYSVQMSCMSIRSWGGGACLERFNECLLKNWLSFQLALWFLPVLKCQVKVLLEKFNVAPEN